MIIEHVSLLNASFFAFVNTGCYLDLTHYTQLVTSTLLPFIVVAALLVRALALNSMHPETKTVRGPLKS